MNKSMQIIALINQKGRGWKTASKQLTNILKYFLKKEGFF
jgi:hypothetical protein